MQPTLNPMVNGKPRHEWVWVSKIGSRRFRYNRGDVVMLKWVIRRSIRRRSPNNPTRYLVKRIVAVPGDWVQLKGNKLVRERDSR